MKNNIVRSFSIITFLGINLMASGQTIDNRSKTILDDITKSYKSKKNSYFKFSYSTGNSKTSQNQTGIFYSDNTRYKLKIMGTEQIFDGNKLYNINDDDKEVTISKANDDQVHFSPLSYLDSYKKEYNVSYSGKKTISGIPVDIVKMTPVKANGLKSVTLYINSPQKKLIKLEQLSTNDEIATITISNYKENQTLSPSLFSFDKNKYQNYLITEL
ncbi:LolA family protein [Epilithonimonas hungarica]|uniref:Outer membrane lipoprotein-sorting protein n=1 Tax=Epilithonimonas hungarica TaxID=454006 RepID=A0A1G7JAG7_9FLAO|nr:outer membrane lipoprotein carrier protein LolA [Epilithonimonas hungarica]MPT31558.1 outer membrane lipoprotein carrier protein LolA [Chryseobacterium sp.]SDF21901.1 Outer membrane lipoprotein-sorting protein [Epilithonimonas hungarica]